MAFIVINNSQIETGDPVTQELWQKTKDNFDDHETRITTNSANSAAFDPIDFNITGKYSSFGAKNDLLVYRVVFDLTILAARLVIWEAGISGTTEVDIRLDDGSPATIFSTRPSVAFGAGDRAVSVNAVLSTTIADAGDFFILDQTAVQTKGDGYSLYLEIEAR